ncbi:MAG: hypothetical protein ABI383_09320, partial [Acidobacteriaceae bacterium]
MQFVITVATLAFLSASDAKPPSPYIDHGVCPFECCTYRNWQAKRKVGLFDRPDGKRIGELEK